jgi:hypothetical protein
VELKQLDVYLELIKFGLPLNVQRVEIDYNMKEQQFMRVEMYLSQCEVANILITDLRQVRSLFK